MSFFCTFVIIQVALMRRELTFRRGKKRACVRCRNMGKVPPSAWSICALGLGQKGRKGHTKLSITVFILLLLFLLLYNLYTLFYNGEIPLIWLGGEFHFRFVPSPSSSDCPHDFLYMVLSRPWAFLQLPYTCWEKRKPYGGCLHEEKSKTKN